ncbi:MAG: hypothetical protein IKS45_13480, partial [Thermoguttaceae bacterium]|nr:hypothetical protein [Thermoguttaceae bacterium]
MRTRMIYGIAAAIAALNVCFGSLGWCNSIDSAPSVKDVVTVEFASAEDAAKATLTPTALP